MKQQSTLSAKGHLVVPLAVRVRLGIRPGDKVRFVETPNGVMIEKVRPSDVDDPFATFAEWASPDDDAAYREL